MTGTHREVRDGRDVVVKTAAYDLRTEAAGLAALAAAGADVPDVLVAQEQELVIAHVTGDGDWAACAQRLAQVHRTTGETFGWHEGGFLGPLAVDNTPTDDWPAFYAERRLAPLVGSLPGELERRVRGAMDDGRMAEVLDHGAVPSLVHGDHWTGNVVGGQWLIDPSVHHADRELDLAMARVFGGIPAAFFAAYEEAWPLDDGWERRVPALQLYYLVFHVHRFGGGYVASTAGLLDELGW